MSKEKEVMKAAQSWSVNFRDKFLLPKTKLSGLKICPKGPERTESMVPGSRSTRMALGTYFPPANTQTPIRLTKTVTKKSSKRKREKCTSA